MQDFTKMIPNNRAPDSSLAMKDNSVAAENARFMSKVYLWMSFGILLSAGVSFAIFYTPSLFLAIYSNPLIFIGLVIVQLGSVVYLSVWIKKMSATTATVIYLLYSILTGISLSVVFMIYTRSSIFSIFGMTAFSFAGLSAFGYFTKRDLGPVGSFCMMGLWGMIGFALVSLFFPSPMRANNSQVYSIIGIIVFAGLTAYDSQKIKASNQIGNEGTAEDHKEAIIGALILYLDFINLFLHLLRLLGRRR